MLPSAEECGEALPRGSRADRREAGCLTNVAHVGRLMGQKHRSSIDTSRLCRSAHRGSWHLGCAAQRQSSQRTWSPDLSRADLSFLVSPRLHARAQPTLVRIPRLAPGRASAAAIACDGLGGGPQGGVAAARLRPAGHRLPAAVQRALEGHAAGRGRADAARGDRGAAGGAEAGSRQPCRAASDV